jgi:4-hydroxy-tetrahydrodipicolinate reductase
VVIGDADIVVEFTVPDAVMGNLERWRAMGVHAVVGTSGFDAARLDRLAELWGDGPPNCLVVPNFSIGAVLMMRFAELAAPHFAAAEIVELHHDRKADAPSGTAAATAARVAAAGPGQHRAVESVETVPGTRGGVVDAVRVHSVRLPGLLAHQEVLFGTEGELLTIRHDSTDRSSFLPGVLAGIRAVGDLPGVTVGLDRVLGI